MKKIRSFGLLLFFAIGCSGLFPVHACGILPSIEICEGESVNIETYPGYASYLWNPSINIDDPTIYNPTVTPTQTTTYYVEMIPTPNLNLVTNGDFELGNTGFQSDYTFTATPSTNQGYYGIFTNPQQFNGGFSPCSDHSPTGSGRMLVVDGATILNENVWCQSIDLEFERNYNFSAWITNVHPTEPSILQFSINNELLGSPLQIQDGVCVWKEFSAEWYSDCESTATICITNQSTVAFGNDFAIDDISFTLKQESYIDTIIEIVVLENSFQQIDTIACENGGFFFGGQTVPAGTQMDFTYTAFNGCDSTISIEVGVIDTFYFETRTDTLCPGESIFYQGLEIFRDTAICDIYSTVLGCDSTYCFVVYFLTEATIAIDAQAPSCPGVSNGSLLAEPFAGVPPYQFLWDNGSNTPFIDQLSAGTYFLTVTDSKNCIAEKTIVLEDPLTLGVDLNFTPPTCFGDQNGSLEIIPQGGSPDYLIWWEGRMIESTFLDSLSAKTYDLRIEDRNACALDTQIIMPQPSSINISVIEDTSIILGESLELSTIIFSDFPYSFVWTPTFDLDCLDCESPEVLPFESRTYQITVEDTLGCSAVEEVRIEVVKNYELFIPNAFSPNDDGINDLLEIYTGRDVAMIERFAIFDRWGGILFEEKNCSAGQIQCAWDGRSNTKKLQEGIYVYLVEARFIDEAIKTFAGDVLLIR